MKKKLRRFLRLAGTLVVMAAITLFLVEMVLLVVDPFGISYVSELNRINERLVPNDFYAYVHEAGLEERYGGADVTTNRFGLRSPEFEPIKQPGRSRLLVLGDSVVFGWGVAQDRIVSAELQRLADADGGGWEVIAAGVNSWNTRTEYEYLREKAGPWGIDAVVLIVLPNDIVPKLRSRTFVDRKALFPDDDGSGLTLYQRCWMTIHDHLRSVQILRSFYITRVRTHPVLELLEAHGPAERDAKKAFEQIVEFCREREIHLSAYLFIAPSTPYEELFRAMYEDAARAVDFDLHEFPGQLYDPIYQNSNVDRHPNAEAHRLMARRIHSDLEGLFRRPAGNARSAEAPVEMRSISR